METVTVSPKYQIVIPKHARQSLGIQAGQKLDVFVYDGRIELILHADIQSARGFLKGIDTQIDREPDRT